MLVIDNYQVLLFIRWRTHDEKTQWERISGIHVVGKGAIGKTRSWKVRNKIGKIKVGKFEQKIESSGWSWKVTYEVGKWFMKSESLYVW